MPDEATFHETISKARSLGLGDEVQKRILLGTYAVTTEAWDSYFMSAVAARHALIDDMERQLTAMDLRTTRKGSAEGVDVLVHPTSLRGAPRLSEDPASEYAQDVLTTYGNLVGVPVLSAPAAERLSDSDSARLPVGISFAAQWGHDDLLLHVVELLQEHTSILAKRAGL